MILRGSVYSQTLEMDTGITVYIPDKVKPDNPYKTAYLLHGLKGSNGDWINYTMLPVHAGNYDVIFIMPEVARSFYANMKYGLKYYSYITEELPVICQRVFNISSQREDTAIIGNSMGGYGALKCALSQPQQYGYCCAFSPPCLFLHEDMETQRANGYAELKASHGEQLLTDFKAIFGEELDWDSDYEILAMAKKISSQPLKPKIFTACGTEDYLYADNIRFCREMKKLNFDYTYEEWSGKHDWYFFNEALQRALPFCFGMVK